MFYRKFLIIFIIQFFHWKKEMKIMVILFIIFIFLWNQARRNPYLTDDLNAFDFKATLIVFCTIFTGFFLYESNNQIIEILVLLAIFGLNTYFWIVWIRKMLLLRINIFMKWKFFNKEWKIFKNLIAGKLN